MYNKAYVIKAGSAINLETETTTGKRFSTEIASENIALEATSLIEVWENKYHFHVGNTDMFANISDVIVL